MYSTDTAFSCWWLELFSFFPMKCVNHNPEFKFYLFEKYEKREKEKKNPCCLQINEITVGTQ